jgi:hypothetical protein
MLKDGLNVNESTRLRAMYESGEAIDIEKLAYRWACTTETIENWLKCFDAEKVVEEKPAKKTAKKESDE